MGSQPSRGLPASQSAPLATFARPPGEEAARFAVRAPGNVRSPSGRRGIRGHPFQGLKPLATFVRPLGGRGDGGHPHPGVETPGYVRAPYRAKGPQASLLRLVRPPCHSLPRCLVASLPSYCLLPHSHRERCIQSPDAQLAVVRAGGRIIPFRISDFGLRIEFTSLAPSFASRDQTVSVASNLPTRSSLLSGPLGGSPCRARTSRWYVPGTSVGGTVKSRRPGLL